MGKLPNGVNQIICDVLNSFDKRVEEVLESLLS